MPGKGSLRGKSSRPRPKCSPNGTKWTASCIPSLLSTMSAWELSSTKNTLKSWRRNKRKRLNFQRPRLFVGETVAGQTGNDVKTLSMPRKLMQLEHRFSIMSMQAAKNVTVQSLMILKLWQATAEVRPLQLHRSSSYASLPAAQASNP